MIMSPTSRHGAGRVGAMLVRLLLVKSESSRCRRRARWARPSRPPPLDLEAGVHTAAKATRGTSTPRATSLPPRPLLKVDHLKGILSVHSITPKGNKAELQVQLRSLLSEKMSKGASEQAVVAEMKRLTAVAAATRAVNDRALALPAPQQEQEAAPMLLHGPQA